MITAANQYNPDYAVPPGWVLEDELGARGISQSQFARLCGLSAKLISEIIAGKAPIEPETAVQFDRVLGGGSDIWLRMESTYRLRLAQQEALRPTTSNTLYYGDNLQVLRDHVPSESVDLVYLDPPFNSNASYNVLFRERTGEESPAQIRAFTDTWEWTQETERTFEIDIIQNPAVPSAAKDMISAFPPVRRPQRHYGLLGDDGAPLGGTAPRLEAQRQPVPALRPDGQPLLENSSGCGFWDGELQERGYLEKDNRTQ